MILDTSFLVDVLRGEASALEWEERLDESEVGIVTAVTVMELWEGIHLADSTAAEREAVEGLLTGLLHADFDRESARRAGETNAVLQEAGQSIDVEDVMIGAIAADRDEPVLTRNVDDFEQLPNVEIREY